MATSADSRRPCRPGAAALRRGWSRACRRVVQAVDRARRVAARQAGRARRAACAGASWCRAAEAAPRPGTRAWSTACGSALLHGGVGVAPGRPAAARRVQRRPLSLVDDDTIEREILTSRLALAIMDRASGSSPTCARAWRTLEGRDELDAARHAARPRAGAHRLRRLARRRADAWRAGASCSPCCTTSSRCSSKRPTTRPTAG